MPVAERALAVRGQTLRRRKGRPTKPGIEPARRVSTDRPLPSRLLSTCFAIDGDADIMPTSTAMTTRVRRGERRGLMFGAPFWCAARSAEIDGDAAVQPRLRAALPIVVAVLLASFSSQDARARDLWVTPAGGVPGYDGAGEKMADQTMNFEDAWGAAKPGDVIHLLADNADPARIAPYTKRFVLSAKQSPEGSPIVLKGVGPRTRVVGKGLEAVRACPLPADYDKHKCATGLTAQVTSSAPRDLLETQMDAADAVPDESALPKGLFGRNEIENRLFSIKAHGEGRLTTASCIDLVDVDGITIEDMHFENCALSAVRATKSSRITLRNLTIFGGSYGLAVRGKPGKPARDITVEGVRWIQDTSGYEPLDPAGPWRCIGGARGDDGCAGAMWRSVPWGASHHGTYEHYNGALLAGIDVTGPVVFRKNKILSAYNGIRLKPSDCEADPRKGKHAKIPCHFSNNVWIYDNTFAYIRDNPIEMEIWSSNVYVYWNTIRNAHAWFSFDEMAGGPIYIYGNQGWFDDAPAYRAPPGRGGFDTPCEWHARVKVKGAPADYDPALDRRFDYVAAHWLPVGMREYGENGARDEWMVVAEQPCERGRAGRVVKLALPPKTWDTSFKFPYAEQGIYVVNNSWYLRAPLLSTGPAAKLFHRNNAIEFCDTDSTGSVPFCNAAADITPPYNCGDEYMKWDDLKTYTAASGKTPFFDCFRWLPYDEKTIDIEKLESDFDFDVSSTGFPEIVTEAIAFEPNGRHALPGFRSGRTGDFRLSENAVAAHSDCAVRLRAGGGLDCDPASTAGAYAGALSPLGDPYPGPLGLKAKPPW